MVARHEILNIQAWNADASAAIALTPYVSVDVSARADLSIDTLSIVISDKHPAMSLLRTHRNIPVIVSFEVNGVKLSGLVTTLLQTKDGEVTITVSGDSKHAARMLARARSTSAIDGATAQVEAPVGDLAAQMIGEAAQRTGLPVYILQEHEGDLVQVEVGSEDTIADVLAPVLEASDTFIDMRMIFPGDELPGEGDILRVQGRTEFQWEQDRLAAGAWPQAKPHARLKRAAIMPPTTPMPHLSWAGWAEMDETGSTTVKTRGVCWMPFDIGQHDRGYWQKDDNYGVRVATVEQLDEARKAGWFEHVTRWAAGTFGDSNDTALRQAVEAGLVVKTDGSKISSVSAALSYIGSSAGYAWFDGTSWVLADEAAYQAEDVARNPSITQLQTPGVLVHIHAGRDRRNEVLFSATDGGGLEDWQTTTTSPEAAMVHATTQLSQSTLEALQTGTAAIDPVAGILTPGEASQYVGELPDVVTAIDVNASPFSTVSGTDISRHHLGGAVNINAAGAFFYREMTTTTSSNTVNPVAEIGRAYAEAQGSTSIELTPGFTQTSVFGDDVIIDGRVIPGWKPGDRVSFTEGITRISEVVAGFELHAAWDTPLRVTPVLSRADNGVLDTLARRIRQAERDAANALQQNPRRVPKDDVDTVIDDNETVKDAKDKADSAIEAVNDADGVIQRHVKTAREYSEESFEHSQQSYVHSEASREHSASSLLHSQNSLTHSQESFGHAEDAANAAIIAGQHSDKSLEHSEASQQSSADSHAYSELSRLHSQTSQRLAESSAAQSALSVRHSEEAQRFSQAAHEASVESAEHSAESLTHSNTAKGYSDSASGYSDAAKAHSDTAAGHSAESLTHSQNAATAAGEADEYAQAASGYSDEARGYSDSASGHSDAAARHSATAKSHSDSAFDYSEASKTYSEAAATASSKAEAAAQTVQDLQPQIQNLADEAAAASSESSQHSANAKSYSEQSSEHSQAATEAKDLSLDALRDAELARDAAETSRRDAESKRDEAEQARKKSHISMVAASNSMATAERSRAAAEQARADAEASRALAEDDRQAAEAARDRAETARSDAESARAEAETARSNAEENRKAGFAAMTAASSAMAMAEQERAEAEQARADAEASRALAESDRQDAEAARDRAETARSDAESARSAAESFRDDAEQKRAAADTARTAAETARSDAESERSKAEAARDLAEEYRDDAESKRAAAESERALAEEARKRGFAAMSASSASMAAAERSRASAEAQRSAAESERALAEEERQAAEAARENAEIARDAAINAFTDAQAAIDAEQNDMIDQIAQMQKEQVEQNKGRINQIMATKVSTSWPGVDTYTVSAGRWGMTLPDSGGSLVHVEWLKETSSGLQRFLEHVGYPAGGWDIDAADDEIVKASWATVASVQRDLSVSSGAFTPSKSSTWTTVPGASLQAYSAASNGYIKMKVTWAAARRGSTYGIRFLVDGQPTGTYTTTTLGPYSFLGDGDKWMRNSISNVKVPAGGLVEFQVYCSNSRSSARQVRKVEVEGTWIEKQ